MAAAGKRFDADLLSRASQYDLRPTLPISATPRTGDPHPGARPRPPPLPRHAESDAAENNGPGEAHDV